METVTNTPASKCHILSNSPALHSLKRQQLVQLCKRNGIKATGKNSEMVEKLKAYASSHAFEPSFLNTEATPSFMAPMHVEEPPEFDTLPATPTPFHAHPQTGSPLPPPQQSNDDDSRDQSILDLGARTIRLVTTAPTAPSPPVLRPFTPSFEPSCSPESLPPVPPPFVFGSPAHRISNNEFNSAATSVLAEMNARLGLTGTSDEVGLDLLQKGRTAETAPLPELPGRPRDLTIMFDQAHQRQFQKMEGLGEWYARRNAGSSGTAPQDIGANRKRKSDIMGGPHRRPIGPSNARARRTSRVIMPGTRRSLIAAAEAEDIDGRNIKRVRISVVDRGDKRVGESESDSEEVAKSHEERERERAAIKKKLEISRARRRSSMGRVSVGGGKPPLIPNQTKKGMTTKFGFLSSAKSIVKSVWKGVGSGASKQISSMPAAGPSQKTVLPATKHITPNVLTKPAPTAKPNTPKAPLPKSSTVTPDLNTSIRSTTGIGLGRKISTKAGTNSITGTRTSTASSGTRSIFSSFVSGIPGRRRGAIPSFQQPRAKMSRANSLASAGGTLGGSSGTGGSRGSSAANSIGLKKPGIPSGVRPSDDGNSSTNSVVRKRTSTLFAPTASSLAKMQSTVRPSTFSSAASRSSAKVLAKVQERKPLVPSGLSSFTFISPSPVGGNGALTPSKATGSIFPNMTPSLPPSQAPASEVGAPKPRAPAARRPRISRSRVIARVGAQRAASGSSLTRTPSGRRSFNVPKTKGSLGVRASGVGARNSAAMSAQKRQRQSEILRRRSKLSGVSPALQERVITPDDGNGNGPEGGGDASLDISMEG